MSSLSAWTFSSSKSAICFAALAILSLYTLNQTLFVHRHLLNMALPTSSLVNEAFLVRASAKDMQELLATGATTSVEIVKACLAQIEKYDRQGPNLRAVITTAPKDLLLKSAAALDKEREDGHVRGKLHGIPMLIKDAISSAPDSGMPTTLGSWAFKSTYHKHGSPVVTRLVEQGLIVLGKASLTELGNFKGDNITSGWSALGGQCQSAYIPGGVKPREERLGQTAPGGSSSGSGVGVAAGYAPISIGTELDGSTVTPASRSALYGMKPSNGLMSMAGVFRVTETFDTIGSMAKTVGDLAVLMDLVIDDKPRSQLPMDGHATYLSANWSGVRMGMVDPQHWVLPATICSYDKEIHEETKASIFRRLQEMRDAGAVIQYPVDLKHPSTFSPNMPTIIHYESRRVIEEYLSGLDNTGIRTVEDLLQWNVDHADLELPEDYPNQKLLQSSADANVSDAQYKQALDSMRQEALHDALEATLDRWDIDVIIGPMDSPLASVAACSGGPIATVPIGRLSKSGRPFGFAMIARPGDEAALFRAMSAYEAKFPERELPPLVNSSADGPSL